jgi:LuxR family transcriptional regulator, quorum-sensing system regulator BjaR1
MASMSRNSIPFGRDAFDFIDDVQHLSTGVEIMERLGVVLGDFGIKSFCFNFLPTAEQSFQDVLLANRLPFGWLKLYQEQQFLHDDPSMRHCRRMRRPFRWFKDVPYDADREPRALEVVQRAFDFGLLDGIVVPVASGGSQVGHVWMGGTTVLLPESHQPALHLMALYAFDRVRCLHQKHPEERPRITLREREVLKWVAAGKSAWEIGEILNLSKRTVDEHAQTASRKLGAVNRTQAVAIAIRERLIQA